MRWLLAGLVALMANPALADDAAFFAAARANDAAALTQLLAAGQDVEARDAGGATALLIATHADALAAATALVEAGADVNARDGISDTPYLYAGAEGRTEILKLLLASGANLTDTNRFGGTALIPAAEKGHPDNVRLLLEAGVDPDHINNLGWTALVEAIVLTDGGPVPQQIVQLLIDGGADVNLADGTGASPLALAQQRGFSEIVAQLEAAGAT
ncbi:MAG: ankyrin repeat domain-containing protein [Hyphomicrobiales bacterium]|nr:MAG: ankyrin repeat domain-containing protein [Hyphomicrobiales bacterium]